MLCEPLCVITNAFRMLSQGGTIQLWDSRAMATPLRTNVSATTNGNDTTRLQPQCNQRQIDTNKVIQNKTNKPS
jgi:hypothetical protein